MSIGKIKTHGMPVPSRAAEAMVDAPAPCKSRQASFAEGLDIGMDPRMALMRCNPSKAVDVTPDRLAICDASGLLEEEIAAAFGVTCEELLELRQGPIYIAFGNLSLKFREQEVEQVMAGWNSGRSIEDIAGLLGRPVEAVFILLLDLGCNGKIEHRPGGIFGRGAA